MLAWNMTTTNSSFLLDTTSGPPDNPHDFSAPSCLCGIVLGVVCNIFPAGRFNASIRSARAVATGFVPVRKAWSSAATAARRCITCRRRLGLDSDCARGRWAPTARCAGRGSPRLCDLARRKHTPAANG